jgi:hypothetical protein
VNYPMRAPAKESCCNLVPSAPKNGHDDYCMAISLRESFFRLAGSSARARLRECFVGEMSIHAGLSWIARFGDLSLDRR